MKCTFSLCVRQCLDCKHQVLKWLFAYLIECGGFIVFLLLVDGDRCGSICGRSGYCVSLAQRPWKSLEPFVSLHSVCIISHIETIVLFDLTCYFGDRSNVAQIHLMCWPFGLCNDSFMIQWFHVSGPIHLITNNGEGKSKKQIHRSSHTVISSPCLTTSHWIIPSNGLLIWIGSYP